MNEERTAIRIEHKNRFGEVMTLSMDRDGELWFQHDDCNIKPENFKDLNVKYKLKGLKEFEGFKYVLDEDERIVLDKFLEIAGAIAGKVSEYHWK